MQEIINKFTTHLKNVLTRALTFVVENEQESVRPEHLLWALATQKGCIGAELLAKAGIKVEDVRHLLTERSLKPVTRSVTSIPTLSDAARRMVEKAVMTANVYEHRYVGTEHLLSGLLQIEDEMIAAFFTKQKIDLVILKEQVATVLKSTSRFKDMTGTVMNPGSSSTQTKEKPATTTETPVEEEKTAALDYFGYELTTEEAQKDIDPVIGREQEIERVLQILCRRTKNNPILLGEPGVGKTAIVEGLAKKILAGDVPPALRGKRIYALDLSMVIAGTMYRGEFEGRLKQIVEETKKNDDIILFIDEVHMIVGAGSASGSLDAANMLKPALARGEIRCIGATTPSEYKKHFETDAALERRFCPVAIDEPSVEKTIEILNGVRKTYELYHNVIIADDAIEAAVTLSNRYIQEKHQPDKSLDLIDESAAAMRLQKMIYPAETKKPTIESELKEVREAKRLAVAEERFHDAVLCKEKEEILLTRVPLIINNEEIKPLGTVTEEHVAAVVARMTGIPLNQLVSEERRLKKIEEALGKHVLGQTAAVKTAAQAIRRAKSGVGDPKRPLASFLFLGPSGVGKTELAKAIAAEVFQDEKAFIQLDMSEFAEGFSISKLVGAPAGYVGYRESTKLTDRVKQKPYAVILFDELEKAHKDVLNLLLQILEQGALTDATGRPINFKNTIIAMTSNAGVDKFERGEIGFASKNEVTSTGGVTPPLRDDMRRELEEHFRPEFLNRIDHICVFQPLERETLTAIAQKMLSELTVRLQKESINITLDNAIALHIAEQANPRLGARDLRRLISEQIETQIADAILGATIRPALTLSLSKGKILVKKNT